MHAMPEDTRLRQCADRLVDQMGELCKMVETLHGSIAQVALDQTQLRKEVAELRAVSVRPLATALGDPLAALLVPSISSPVNLSTDMLAFYASPVFPECDKTTHPAHLLMDHWEPPSEPPECDSDVQPLSESEMATVIHNPPHAELSAAIFNPPHMELLPVIHNPPRVELLPAAIRTSRRTARRVSGPLRILVVEDDPVCQQLICRIVHSLAIGQVEVVPDGVDAVINMSTGSFDLVLMDIQLPRLDGLQATQNIRKFNRRTPIVSMTGHVGAEDLLRYYEGGIDDVLPKPFDSRAVLHIIEQFYKLSVKDNGARGETL